MREDFGGLAGIIGLLSIASTLGVATAESGFHRGAQRARADCAALFEIEKKEPRHMENAMAVTAN